uniref:RING-type domain-containing protein n=1 Tax=viral metagenome TaxID=1070528 RepID=A0A6C0JDK4_9ZZZZ
MRRIDPTLFEEIYYQNFDNFKYTIYRPIGNPIILFSLIDGSPLAALTLKTQTGNSGQSIIVKKPEKELLDIPYDFQGIIDKDNQEFEFVITNFCDCLINFNILREDNKVTEVNPGAFMSVNKVNELHPGQSYAIKCDQKNNLTLILNKIFNSETEIYAKPISLAEENINVANLKSKPGKIKDFSPRGIYYYLSVVPQNTAVNTIKKFEKTKWECVDFFIRKEQIVKADVQHLMVDGGEDEEDVGGYDIFGDEEDVDDVDDVDGYDDFCELDEQPCCDIRQKNKTLTETDSAILPIIGKHKIAPINTITNSSISSVGGGKRIMEYSRETGVDYDYNSNSVRCILTLTVNEDLVLFTKPKLETLLGESRAFLTDILKNKSTLLLNDIDKIYNSDNCCICLESNPDIIFYQCGHQCVHKADKCSNGVIKCPLCRKFIVAKLI